MKLKTEHYIIIVFAVAFVFLIGILLGLFLKNDLNFKKDASKDFDIAGFDIKKSVIQIPGVDSRNQGVSAVLETNIREGSGFILVNINDLIAGSSTQQSARIAVRAAKNYLDLNDNFDIDVIYNIKTDAGFIDGPSAGAAMAVSLISLLENKTLSNKISITGYIEEDGTIGPASGIEQKAFALKKEGIEMLIASEALTFPRDSIRKKYCVSENGREYCEIDYIAEEEIIVSNLKIVLVKNLEEALKYFYEENNGEKNDLE